MNPSPAQILPRGTANRICGRAEPSPHSRYTPRFDSCFAQLQLRIEGDNAVENHLSYTSGLCIRVRNSMVLVDCGVTLRTHLGLVHSLGYGFPHTNYCPSAPKGHDLTARGSGTLRVNTPRMRYGHGCCLLRYHEATLPSHPSSLYSLPSCYFV